MIGISIYSFKDLAANEQLPLYPSLLYYWSMFLATVQWRAHVTFVIAMGVWSGKLKALRDYV